MDVFDRYQLLRRGRNTWVVAQVPGLTEALDRLRIETAGIPLLRQRTHPGKPTTTGLVYLDAHITKNVVDLDGLAAVAFLRGQILRGPFAATRGFVAVRTGGHPLGCGLYSREGLKSQLPRPWRNTLLGDRQRMKEADQT